MAVVRYHEHVLFNTSDQENHESTGRNMAVALKQTTQPKRHHISLEEFERMVEAGVFEDNTRLELIRGEILEMPPPSYDHQRIVARLIKLLERRAGDFVLIWPQGNSIDLPESDSQPQPDVALLRLPDNYSRSTPPVAKDVLLAIEVSDTSLQHDRTKKRALYEESEMKRALYAESEIPEYWIINLRRGTVEVYTNLQNGDYANTRRVGKGEFLSVPGAVDASIGIDEIMS